MATVKKQPPTTNKTVEQLLAEQDLAALQSVNTGEGDSDLEGDGETTNEAPIKATVETAIDTSSEPSLQASGTVTFSSANEVNVNAGLTKIVIAYPETFEGTKFFQDGEEKFVSPELAEQFVNLGIATIIEA